TARFVAVTRFNIGIRSRGFLGSESAWSARRHDNVHLMTDQLGDEGWEALIPPLCPPVLNADVLTVGVTVLAESLAECVHEIGLKGRGRVTEVTNTGYRRPLRLHAARRGEHGSQASDEGATVHRVGSRGMAP